MIPGLGRSVGKGIDYPLQYSWASLLAQLVKNLPAMQETWVQLLSWETPSCPWRRAWQSFQYTIPVGSDGKESACNAGDLGLIPGLVRSPGEGKGYPLQYSGLENSLDCIVHGVTKSWTPLSDFHNLLHSFTICKIESQ